MGKESVHLPLNQQKPGRRRMMRLGALGAAITIGATLLSTSGPVDALTRTFRPNFEADGTDDTGNKETNTETLVPVTTDVAAATTLSTSTASTASTTSASTTSNTTRKNWPLRAEVDTGLSIITNLPSTAELNGLRFQQQTFNNCGPASLSMVLSYFGRAETQQDIAAVIKPYNEDKNVTAEELIAYAQSIGYNARVIEGGDINLLKAFVANGLPVIAERWLPETSDGPIGHFQVVMGYDQSQIHFFDSLQGQNIKEGFASFDEGWQVFNRHFIAFWPASKESTVKTLLGARWDEKVMLQKALATAQAEAKSNPDDKFAWFNVGTNQIKLGNASAAVEAYDKAEALQLPARMLWYQFGIYEANLAIGNYEAVIALTTDTINTTGLEENHYWRGLAYSAMGNQTAARRDFTRALQYNENYQPAQDALQQLNNMAYSP